VLDSRQFGWRAELTPANAGRTVIDKSGVGSTLADTALFFLAALCAALCAFRMELKTPAPAPNAVMSFNKGSEV